MPEQSPENPTGLERIIAQDDPDYDNPDIPEGFVAEPMGVERHPPVEDGHAPSYTITVPEQVVVVLIRSLVDTSLNESYPDDVCEIARVLTGGLIQTLSPVMKAALLARVAAGAARFTNGHDGTTDNG